MEWWISKDTWTCERVPSPPPTRRFRPLWRRCGCHGNLPTPLVTVREKQGRGPQLTGRNDQPLCGGGSYWRAWAEQLITPDRSSVIVGRRWQCFSAPAPERKSSLFHQICFLDAFGGCGYRLGKAMMQFYRNPALC